MKISKKIFLKIIILKKINDLKNENKKYKLKNDENKQKINELESKIKELNSKNEKYQEINCELNEQHKKKINSVLNDEKKKFNENLKEMNNIKQENKNLQIKNNELQSVIENYISKNNEMLQKENEFIQEKAVLNKKIFELEQNMKKINQDSTKSNKVIDQLNIEIKLLKDKNEENEEKNNELKKVINKIENEKIDLNNNLILIKMEKEEILKKFKYRFNVYELFKKEKYVPPITYYVNVLSHRDIEIQAKPLIEELCEFNYFNNLDMHFYSEKKKDPHHPLPLKKTIAIIKDFSKNYLNNFVNIENLKENSNSIKTNFIGEDLSYLKEKYSYILKYGTARVDIKNKGQKNNSIEILYNSDEKSRVDSPSWFKNDEGTGFTFHTTERRLDLKIKCINDGILNIMLRGVYFKDKNNILPIYIKYNNVQINDLNVLKEETLVWHNKPYYIRKKVHDGDIIFISIFWSPI